MQSPLKRRSVRTVLLTVLALVCVGVMYVLHAHRRTTILVPESSNNAVIRANGEFEEKAEQENDLGVRRTVSGANLQQDTVHHEDHATHAKETTMAVEESHAPTHQTEAPSPPEMPREDSAINPREGPTVGAPLQRKHNDQQKAVVAALKHAWKGYTDYAWGRDELMPLSKRGTNSFGMGMTIVDSLDTLWLMGLTEEFEKARQWVANSMNIVGNRNSLSVFETTIRVLGGLLSAYHLSNDKIFLQRAVELGDRLLPAFNSPTGIPYGQIDLNRGPKVNRVACVAEMASLQLEFRDLSHSTGDIKYQNAVDKALKVLQDHVTEGIATQEVDVNSGSPRYSMLTIGARTDSYYEYLLKQWVQSGKREETFRKWYSTSANSILKKFVKHSQPHHMAFLAQLHSVGGGSFSSKMDHLTCFFPGVLALGYHHGFPEQHLVVAKNLTHTCYQMYRHSVTGLSPDEVTFNTNPNSGEDFYSTFSGNILRPETVESIFILYRVTKDPVYREWGWKILQAFEKHSKVSSGGYATIDNVNRPNPSRRDKMESFFLAETLKYLFLLFTDDPDILSLDEWVFNTEAHPLPVWTT